MGKNPPLSFNQAAIINVLNNKCKTITRTHKIEIERGISPSFLFLKVILFSQIQISAVIESVNLRFYAKYLVLKRKG